jgi:tetratricopeptide (TPR) repeat protein
MTTQEWALVVSGLAFSVSLVSVGFSIWTNSREHKRVTRSQMNELLLHMTEAIHQNDVHRAGIFSLQAVDLLKNVPSVMNSWDYVTTADALFTAQDWTEARRHWEKGIERSANDSEHLRVSVARGYAERLFFTNDPELGREWYQKAVRIVPNDSDLHKHLNAFTYQMWYYSESYYVLGESSSEEQYRRAKSLYESISNRITRERGLQELEQKRVLFNSPLEPPPPM